MPHGDGYGGRRAQAWVAAVLTRYGTTCHLCHHPGAESGDHLQPRAERPDLMWNIDNGRPVHHRPCPTCGVRCNLKRKSKPLTASPERDELAFFE